MNSPVRYLSIVRDYDYRPILLNPFEVESIEPSPDSTGCVVTMKSGNQHRIYASVPVVAREIRKAQTSIWQLRRDGSPFPED